MTLSTMLNDREYEKFVDVATGTSAVRTSPVASSLMTSSLATVNVGSAKASGTTASIINGLIYKVTQSLGTVTGTPGSVTTYLIDSKIGTIAALTVQAESSTTTYSTTVPVTTDMSWRCDMTGDPDGTQNAAAGVNVILNIHYQK